MPSATLPPLADLHLHAEAGPRLDLILAARGERTPFDWSAWRGEVATLPPGVPRLAAMSRELVPPEIDADPANYRARIEHVLRGAAEAGAIYIEVRFGRDTVTREDFMHGFRQAERRVAERHPRFRAEALATLVPQQEWARTEVLVDACLRASSEGLAGVDIIPEPYNDEADWSLVAPLTERLAAAGLGVTVHAGEFSPANLRAAVALPGIARIGHGIHAAFGESLLELVQRSGVALECCISSNVILGGVESIDAHPIKRLVDADIPVTLNTDKPVRFQTDIRREYELASTLGLTPSDLASATRTAIDFAFTSDERRHHLRTLAAEATY